MARRRSLLLAVALGGFIIFLLVHLSHRSPGSPRKRPSKPRTKYAPFVGLSPQRVDNPKVGRFAGTPTKERVEKEALVVEKEGRVRRPLVGAQAPGGRVKAPVRAAGRGRFKKVPPKVDADLPETNVGKPLEEPLDAPPLPPKGDADLDEDSLDSVGDAEGDKEVPGGTRRLGSGGRKVPGVGAAKEGWSQRFKQKPPGAGEVVPDAILDTSPPTLSPPSGLLAHPLLARFVDKELSGSTSSTLSEEEEDSFQAQPLHRSSPSSFNLTICALIPAEQRFLPEWLLYHRLLGVERFALYDTSAAGAAGAGEVDSGADRMAAEGKGEMGPSANDIKKSIGATLSGLDQTGRLYPDRIDGLEHWIEQGVVVLHWMQFEHAAPESFHEQMLRHCSATYSPSSNWLGALDVDEFLAVAPQLYGPNEAYQDEPDSSATKASTPSPNLWRYPLHDLLERPATKEAACVPVPQLKYRNMGIRTLEGAQGVLNTQTRRDVVQPGIIPEKTLIHSAFSSGFVDFDGPHSCIVSKEKPPQSLTSEIRNSQGVVIQDGGVYESVRLPTEPLAIAHFIQRDLTDCHQKLSNLDDPNNLHSKGRGAVLCEEHYLPSPAELASPSFVLATENRFLARVPEEGTIVEDLRVKESWAARGAEEVLRVWREGEGPTRKEVESALDKVVVLLL